MSRVPAGTAGTCHHQICRSTRQSSVITRSAGCLSSFSAIAIAGLVVPVQYPALTQLPTPLSRTRAGMRNSVLNAININQTPVPEQEPSEAPTSFLPRTGYVNKVAAHHHIFLDLPLICMLPAVSGERSSDLAHSSAFPPREAESRTRRTVSSRRVILVAGLLLTSLTNDQHHSLHSDLDPAIPRMRKGRGLPAPFKHRNSGSISLIVCCNSSRLFG